MGELWVSVGAADLCLAYAFIERSYVIVKLLTERGAWQNAQ